MLCELNMAIFQENYQFRGPFSCHMGLQNLHENSKDEAAAVDSIKQPRPHAIINPQMQTNIGSRPGEFSFY